MTLARLARDLKDLSGRMEERFAQVDARFAQVDARFAQVDARFEQQRQEIRQELEAFATRIETHFKIGLEGMLIKLDAALDDTREQKRRLDLFERSHAEEHRLMRAQIDDLDTRLQPRPPRRRQS